MDALTEELGDAVNVRRAERRRRLRHLLHHRQQPLSPTSVDLILANATPALTGR